MRNSFVGRSNGSSLGKRRTSSSPASKVSDVEKENDDPQLSSITQEFPFEEDLQ
jgi:hypothetical protein